MKNSRQMELILVFLCFLFSMLITNDVALITFVPFAIQVLEMADMRKSIVPVVAAQNSCGKYREVCLPRSEIHRTFIFTPDQRWNWALFLKLMLPYTLLAAVLLFGLLLVRKSVVTDHLQMKESGKIEHPRKVTVYGILFLICLLCVSHILPVWLVVLMTIVLVWIVDKGTFKEIDYSLLLTFAGFFIFIGNMGRIPVFCNFLKGILNGNEVLTAVVSSQVLSNVPAALLLSGFTEKWEALIIGTNLGGLGTMIASMASLISYRFLV